MLQRADGMDVLDVIARRRMHRAFTAASVERDDLARLVDAAARAPMAANVAIRRIVVLTDPRRIRTVRALTPGLSVEPPALLVLCSDLEQAEVETGRHGRDISSYIDAGAAAENVALAAAALGLGVSFARSCTERGIQIALDLPLHVRPDILIAVGHPAQTPSRPAPRKRPPIYHDHYGRAWEHEGFDG